MHKQFYILMDHIRVRLRIDVISPGDILENLNSEVDLLD